MNRRLFLLSGIGVPLASGPARAQSRAATPTPSQMEGPFYPVEPIALRADLLRRGGRLAKGTPLMFGGTVTRTGTPLALAKVEIWQCDANGKYRHPQGGVEAMDPGFEGFGAQFTDAQGRYRFQTLMPVPYEPRPPHIHVRVWLGNERLLTTQAYLPGQQAEGGAMGRIASLWGQRDSLVMALSQDQQGRAQARFDISLA